MKALLTARSRGLDDVHTDGDGVLHARVRSPRAFWHLADEALAGRYVRVEMRVTPDGRPPPDCRSRLYYRLAGQRRFTAARCLERPVRDTTDFHRYTFGCIPFQRRAVRDVRFHPLNAPGRVAIRDFRLCDYEPRRDAPPAGTLGVILLSYYSRSGSTLAMKVLTRHPQITGHTEGTHDANILKYFSKLYFMMLRSHVPGGRAGRGVMLDRYSRYIRHYAPEFALPKPFEFNRDLHVEPFRRHWGVFLRGYLPQLLSDIGAPHLEEARYYVEKQMDAAGLLASIRELLPESRVVVAFRDPRDVLVSLGAYERQGQLLVKHASLGRRIDEIMTHYRRRLELVEREPDRCIAYRYEDLLARPIVTLRPVVAFLGLDASEPVLSGMAEPIARPDLQADHHVTAPDPAATIGRWRRELPRRTLRRFGRYADLLSRLGYET
ncbi:MAG: sulfotransferase [Phycisphaerae bacterium]|nr:sulfotransferase [Phycisphaerae bacterium]